MASQAVAGLCYFKIDGVQYTFRGKGKVQVAQWKRERIVNQDGTVSFKKTPIAGSIELEMETTPGFKIQSLASIENSVVTLEATNGTVYTLQSGFQEDELNVDTDEGSVQVKFAGQMIEAPSLS